MRPLGIRLFWAAGAVLLVAVVAAGWLCPWLFPAGDEGNLYRRYEHNPHIEVSYLRNYPLNDTLTIPVTLLQASDSIGWDSLCRTFNLPRYSQKAMAMLDSTTASFKKAPKRDYSLPPDSNQLNNDVIVCFLFKQEACVFHIESEEQHDAILGYLMDESKKKLKHQKLLNN